MANRIFRVDLAEDARDFQHTATEPGLAMLDRAGANHGIMRHWIGSLAAEPEWEQDETVSFFIGQKEEGRLADLECRPATAADLQGPLKQELDTIRSRIKQAKAESTTEEVLLRVVRKSLKETTDDLDVSDCDCYFFKYRQTKQPWKLVWCWGYQRTDMEPSPAVICSNPDCNRLFARRPKNKICPYCKTTLVPAKKQRTFLDVKWLVLLLLLAVGLFFLLNQPRLVVSPGNWTGPPGSRVEFLVKYRRWYFFEKDVTTQVISQSQDSRILQFGPGGRVGTAKGLGQTQVTFLYQNQTTAITIKVAPPKPPERLSIEPSSADLAIGSTAQLKVMGHYSDGSSVDLTKLAQWEAKDRDIVFAHAGRLEGAKAGKTTIVASYQAIEGADPLEATAQVSVVDVEFKSIEVQVSPAKLAIGQIGKIEIVAQGANGKEYWLTGSPALQLNLTPAEIASIDDGYLEGKAAGKGALKASYESRGKTHTNSLAIVVSSESHLPAGTFSVQPLTVELAVDGFFSLDVVTASNDPIETKSSDLSTVDVLGDVMLVGIAPGETIVTVRQGENSRTVKVKVVLVKFESLHIEPGQVTMDVGEKTTIRVVGRTSEGQEIDLVPSSLTWIKKPLLQHADLNTETLEIKGIAPTTASMTIEARHKDGLTAQAPVSVFSRDPLVATTIEDDEFKSYPPIPLTGGFLASDLFSDEEIARMGIPADAYLTTDADGRPLVGRSLREVRDYFDEHPFADGDILRYRDANGRLQEVKIGENVLVQEVRLLNATPINESATDFQVKFSVDLRREAEYRVVDGNDQPLSEFVKLGRGPAVISTTSVARASDNKYEFWIQRKLDDQVDRYPLFSGTLELE